MSEDWRDVLARVRSALMRRGRSSHDAEDLVQEAWLRLACYEHADALKQPEAFLMRAALNLSIDAHRAHVSRGEEVLLDDVVLADTAPGVEAIALSRERMARLVVCLKRLNRRTRTILLAHRIDAMSYQQIATAQRVSVSAVEKHIAKAMLQLTCWMEGW